VNQKLTSLDRFLQSWRIWMAAKFIKEGSIVADIGCWDAALFSTLKHKNLKGFAIDPLLNMQKNIPEIEFLKGIFPDEIKLEANSIDAITLLAVMEHVPIENQNNFALSCLNCLKPGGKVIMTIPSPHVDRILLLLKKCRLIKGMETNQHYGLNPKQTFEIFVKAGFLPVFSGSFQAGLNNLFVFSKKEVK